MGMLRTAPATPKQATLPKLGERDGAGMWPPARPPPTQKQPCTSSTQRWGMGAAWRSCTSAPAIRPTLAASVDPT